jgi:hypothetical protein
VELIIQDVVNTLNGLIVAEGSLYGTGRLPYDD